MILSNKHYLTSCEESERVSVQALPPFAVCFQLQTAAQTPGNPAQIGRCGLITSEA